MNGEFNLPDVIVSVRDDVHVDHAVDAQVAGVVAVAAGWRFFAVSGAH